MKCNTSRSYVMGSVVWPVRALSGLKQKAFTPVKKDGIVFYVYNWDFCKNGNRYMEQLKFNIDSIHEKDRNVFRVVFGSEYRQTSHLSRIATFRCMWRRDCQSSYPYTRRIW